MSRWRDERNAQARTRLERALPAVFPAPVLIHALGRSLVPPLPRLAVESYWAAHAMRADRLARQLARQSGSPDGWTWRIGAGDDGLPRSFRMPPAPFREAAHRRGPGWCCICGQPVYRFGWHADLWGDGRRNGRAEWHACCVAAWKLWTAPRGAAPLIRRLQKRRCAASATRLLRSAEIDHRIPLFQVWRDHRDRPWSALLDYWGIPNLQVINRPAHVAKCGVEAGDRAGMRLASLQAGAQDGWVASA